MIKLNITLPSGAQVSIEADDRDLVREVLYSTMPHLNGAAHQAARESNGSVSDSVTRDDGGLSKDHGSPSVQPQPVVNGMDPARDSANGNHPPGYDAPPPSLPAVGRQPVANEPTQPPPPPPPAAAPVAAFVPSGPDEHEFIAFCQRVNPLGDMRRVVVAAEAADRHLAVRSVDPEELERLFTLAGWSIPHSFVQTLRNAARTKFRWLERIPGKSGHYRVTDTGRSIVLGETSANRRNQPANANAPR